MSKKYEMDMTTGVIMPKVITFALPLIAASVLQLLFNAADIVVVGRFVSPQAMAAVGSTGSLVNLIIQLFVGFSIGVNVCVGKYYAAKRQEDMSDTIHTSILVSVIFGAILCAPPRSGDPLSRSYRVNLPSSLTVNHSSALVYSTRLRVSVCGTGTLRIKFSGFSWEYDYTHYWIVPKNAPYYQVRLSERICLPRSTSTPFNELFRQFAALSRLRLHVTL